MRIVRDWSARPRWIAWRIHHVAYVENLKPRCHSNLSTPRIRPALPSWMRSRKPRPRFMYFLALATTSRRFAEVRCSRGRCEARRLVEGRSIIVATVVGVVAGLDPAADRRDARPRRGPRCASPSIALLVTDEPAGGRAVDPVEEREERLGVEPLVVDRRAGCGPARGARAASPFGATRSPRSGRSVGAVDEQVARAIVGDRRRARSGAASSANGSGVRRVLGARGLGLGVVERSTRGGRGSPVHGSVADADAELDRLGEDDLLLGA